DRVIVGCDAGENRLFVLRDFQSRYGGTVLQPSGGGGMGYAIPAAMSAALNAPDCKSVAVCGDGGYSLSLHSLMSAVELGLRMVVLVLDNGLLGWVYNGQRGRYIASELRDFDYAAIARSMGACAATVSTVDELRAELRNALD